MPETTLPPFCPHPLVRGGHVQTLVGAYWPLPASRGRTRPHQVLLDDGDRLALHDDCPPGWSGGDAVCLLLHGLAGSAESGYMQRIAAKLSDRGARVFRMDLRGCGAGEGLARLSTHCGRWGDAAAAVAYIAEAAPDAPLALVGFSLGGTIALNLAAELGAGNRGNLVGIMAVCPPVDLHAVSRRFDSPGGRPYDRHFVRLLWQKTRRRAACRPDFPTIDLSRRPRRLREYDDQITAPLAGFASVDDYYTQTSPGPRLGEVRTPTLILAAADDPVVPAEPLGDCDLSEAVCVVVTPHGGHLGFVGRGGIDADRRWMDWRVVDWVFEQTGNRCNDRFPRSSLGDTSALSGRRQSTANPDRADATLT